MINTPFGSTIKADEVRYYKEYELFERHTGITELKERIADDNNKAPKSSSWNAAIDTFAKAVILPSSSPTESSPTPRANTSATG